MDVVSPRAVSSPLQKIKDAYAEILYLREDDRMIVDYAVSIYTAMLHPQLTELLWGYIIGPASSGKTEVLRIFYEWGKCIGVDEPTANAFQSGYVTETGEDMSLLARLDGMLLFIKDMSVIMQSRPQEAAKIMSILRGAQDGNTSKASGTLGLKNYKASFGLLIATTDIVDQFTEQNQQLGERLMSFRLNRTHLDLDTRQDMLDKARELTVDKEIKRTRLRILAHQQFEVIGRLCLEMASRKEGSKVPVMTEKILRRVQQAADMLAVLRTCAVQGVAGQSEMGYRIVQQTFNLGHAHAIADGRDYWNETDVALVMRVLYDTMAKVRSRVLRGMFRRGVHRPADTIERIARNARTVPEKVAEVFVQFIHSHVVEYTSDSGDMPLYRLSEECYRKIEACDLFSGAE